MSIVQPGLGLIFWQLIIFLVLLYVLTKFAWKPILAGLKEREQTISDALSSAERARSEMASLKSENEKLIVAARKERDLMLAEAKATAHRIIDEARAEASKRAEGDLKQAKLEIENLKKASIADMRNAAAALSVEIAEKLLRDKLSTDDAQKDLVKKYLADSSLQLS